MSGQSAAQRPRQAILGQLPRIYRADGSPIRVLLVDDEPALTNLVKMALHYEGWVVVCRGRRRVLCVGGMVGVVEVADTGCPPSEETSVGWGGGPRGTGAVLTLLADDVGGAGAGVRHVGF